MEWEKGRPRSPGLREGRPPSADGVTFASGDELGDWERQQTKRVLVQSAQVRGAEVRH